MARSLTRTMPASRLRVRQDYAAGDRHECHLGYGLNGRLSTDCAGVRAAHTVIFVHVAQAECCAGQADRHQLGKHDRAISAGPKSQVSDILRRVPLLGGVFVGGFSPLLPADIVASPRWVQAAQKVICLIRLLWRMCRSATCSTGCSTGRTLCTIGYMSNLGQAGAGSLSPSACRSRC